MYNSEKPRQFYIFGRLYYTTAVPEYQTDFAFCKSPVRNFEQVNPFFGVFLLCMAKRIPSGWSGRPLNLLFFRPTPGPSPVLWLPASGHHCMARSAGEIAWPCLPHRWRCLPWSLSSGYRDPDASWHKPPVSFSVRK